MKIRKLLVAALISVAGLSTVNAANETDVSFNKLREICATIARVDKASDSERFVRFITVVKPEFDTPQGREVLNKIHTIATSSHKAKSASYATDYATPNLDLATMIKIMQMLRELGMNVSLSDIQDYVNKVYPLLVYQTENRVKPEVDKRHGLLIDSVYQAPVDEAYRGLGRDENEYKPLGFSQEEINKMRLFGARPKRNGTYLWGMGTYGKKLFWSTNNNYLCMKGYGNFVQPGTGDTAYENSCWACEYERGEYGKITYPNEPDKQAYSDIRPPRMYSYDTTTGVVKDITPSMKKYPVLQNTQGLRSCGQLNGVVFFGGPGLFASDWDSKVSAAFIAYDADADKVISTSDMGDVDGCKVVNVRRWRVINDILYVSVGILHPDTGEKIGAVLRWYGDRQNPWNFHIVGLVPAEAAELAPFNNRIYVGTWGNDSGVFAGPEIPETGLEPVSVNSEMWETVWQVSITEPTATYGRRMSAIAGFHEWRGHLYWGLFSPNYYMLSIAQQMYGSIFSPDALAFILGNYRTPSFWRVDKYNNCEMLYGETENPKPVYDAKGNITNWELEKNGLTARWGRGGFGNFWTIYIWAMQEYDDKFYIGTMDMGILAYAVGTKQFSEETFNSLAKLLGLEREQCGYELLRMTDEEEAPKYITENAFGNDSQYGVRNLEVVDNSLYLGSACMANLMPHGGWHLLKITDPSVPTSVSQPEAKKPGILFEQNDEYVNIATVGGEPISSVEVYDIAGRKITSARPGKHVASIPMHNINGVIIVKVTSSKGQWQFKIK